MHSLGILSRLLQTLLVTLALCFGLSAVHAAAIVQYDFVGTSGITISRAGTSPLNITPVTLVRGAGLGEGSATGAFSSNGWTGEATDYVEFGFDVAAGFEVDLDTIQLSAFASGTGPAVLGLFSSVDNYATSIATLTPATTSGTLLANILDINSLGVVAGNVRFRLRAIGTTSAGGGTIASGGTFRIANYATTPIATTMQVTGTVQNAGGVDSTAPVTTGFAPADNANAIPVTVAPTLTFSEPVKKGTGNILIKRVSDGGVYATIDVTSSRVTVTGTGTQVVITPSVSLDFSTAYYVEVPSGAILDLANNAYAGISSATAWNFTTLAAADDPTVTKITSATVQVKLAGANPSADFYAQGSGQNNFAVYSLATFTIGKIDFGLSGASTINSISTAELSLTHNWRSFTAGTVLELFLTTDALGGNYSGKTYNAALANGLDFNHYTFDPVSLGRFSFDPSQAVDGTRRSIPLDLSLAGPALISRLNTGAEFHIILAAVNAPDAITFSGKGNTFDPGDPSLRLVVQETTGVDTAPPLVAFFTPADNSGGLPISGNLRIDFNELVQKGTGSITIHRVSDGSIFETIDAAGPRVTTALGTVTIDPAGALESAGNYYVNITAGAIQDTQGVPFAGIADATTWNFSTAQPPITQTGPYTISENARAGTVVGTLNPAIAGKEGIRYAALAGSGGSTLMKAVPGTGYVVNPVFTIGDTIEGATGALNPTSAGNFSPVGTPDGLGAYALNATTIRVLMNHEIEVPTTGTIPAGYPYTLANGTVLAKGGARVTYIDIDKTSRRVIDGGLAIARVYDRAGNVVTSASQLNLGGFDRMCSSSLFEPNLFGAGRGLVDRIYFTGEESSTGFDHPHGGTFWALDPANGDFWALPDFGRGSWENAALVDTGTTTHVAFLLGDDSQSTPLWLYVGVKSTAPGANFIERNGLKGGQLYAWKADNGNLTPQQFNGTGALRSGTWVPVTARIPASAGTTGFDAQGYRNDTLMQAAADAAGCFSFSRPEDLSTSPTDGTLVAFASTGRGNLYPADNWGDTYILDLDFANLGTANPLTASILILYSGDDAGGGQFATPEEGLRCPDNLDWADDGFLYVQEDQSNQVGSFGAAGFETSIWRLDTTNGVAVRITQTDRETVLPLGSTDGSVSDVGNWESSGIIDVSTLFGQPGGTLFLFDVQAHSVTNGLIASKTLFEGGQLCFLERGQERGAFAVNPNTGVITLANPEALDAATRPIHYLRLQAYDGSNHTFATAQINVTTTPVNATNSFKAATFNTSLYRDTANTLINDLTPVNASLAPTAAQSQAMAMARVIQRTNPDVLLVNEFDYDAKGRAVRRFKENYLEVGQTGEAPVYYPYSYAPPVNTGVHSGFDLDNNGSVVALTNAPGYGEDAFGFGMHPGQYGFVILSKYPLDTANIRTFQKFLWKDMPGALLPDDPRVVGTGDWYNTAELNVYRLSSKTHADVPVLINGTRFHVLASHPTPPVFDSGAPWIDGVDHNGRRNSDEIRFWSDYVNPETSAYIYDDAELAANNGLPPALANRTGGLPVNSRFILVGDQNADNNEGDSTDPAIKQILGGIATVGGAVIPANPLFNSTFVPAGGSGPAPAGPDDTALFSGVGVRIDYAVPSVFGLTVDSGGVFWPPSSDPIYVATQQTDHHMVFVNLSLTGVTLPPATDLVTYYAPAANLTGTTLQAALQNIIDDHVIVDYGNVDEVMQVIDQDAVNPNNVRLLYSNASLPKTAFVGAEGTGNATSWNREHVWPRNDGVGDNGPDFSDLHHLFPAQVNVNSLRSSRRFAVITGTRVADPFAPESAADTLDFANNNASFEPLDRDKGIVARAMLYMMTRYDGSDALTTDLVLVNNPVFAGSDQGVRDTLLAWNRAYPPTDYERARNNAIYAGVKIGSTTYAQGNRNPFTDFPQFADAIFLGANATSFLKWQYQRFTLAQLAVDVTSGMSADPDADGRSNWAEFLFNGNPLSANDTPLSLTTAGNQVTITFHRPKGTQPVTANVQTATTLGAANFVNVVNWQASATVTDLGEYERVAYTTTLNPAEPTRFWRVKFE